jgi:hypothetical protein
MKHLCAFLAVALGVFAFAARAQADPLLVGGDINPLALSGAGNLFDKSGNYLPGNTAPTKGDYLVTVFNVTDNTVSGWTPNYTQSFGSRDTYTGLGVVKITAVSTVGGVTTVSLTAPTTGDVSRFRMNGYRFKGGVPDNSVINVGGALNYGKHETLAIFHQGDTRGDSTGPTLRTFNGTVGTVFASATAGSKFLTLSNQAADSYMFSSGTVPPPATDFGLINYEGLQPVVNNTGFPAFQLIGDPNINAGANRVPFFFESEFDLNFAGQFDTGKGNQHWDFQISDPAVLQPSEVPAPSVVPEPSSLFVLALALGGASLVAGAAARWRKASSNPSHPSDPCPVSADAEPC